MNAPLLKNPRLGFQDRVLIRRLVQPAPPLADRASQVLILTLPGSSRRSNQIAYRWPSPVPATQGKNWSLRAGLPDLVTDRNRALDQCCPPSVDRWTEMSALVTARLMLFWYRKVSDPVRASKASDGVFGARKAVGGRVSSLAGSIKSLYWPGLSTCTACGRKLTPPSTDLWNRMCASMELLQASCTNATSRDPSGSTWGVKYWLADRPRPLPPGLSGWIAVCWKVVSDGLAMLTVSV